MSSSTGSVRKAAEPIDGDRRLGDRIELAGRVLLVVPFIVISVGHFKEKSEFLKQVPSFLPAPAMWVYLTAIAQVAAGVSFLIRKLDAVAGMLLALLLFVYAGFVWLPGLMSPDAALFKASVGGAAKDLGLAGGALLISAIALRGRMQTHIQSDEGERHK